jgi:ABC-2 type transport system ATP-binding protein
VFVSSHLLHEMEQVAQRVVVIAHGRLVGAVDVDVLDVGRVATVRVRPADDRLADALRTAGATVTPIEDGLDVAGLPAQRVGEVALACGIALRELVERRQGLEESFLSLTGGAA